MNKLSRVAIRDVPAMNKSPEGSRRIHNGYIRNLVSGSLSFFFRSGGSSSCLLHFTVPKSVSESEVGDTCFPVSMPLFNVIVISDNSLWQICPENISDIETESAFILEKNFLNTRANTPLRIGDHEAILPPAIYAA